MPQLRNLQILNIFYHVCQVYYFIRAIMFIEVYFINTISLIVS